MSAAEVTHALTAWEQRLRDLGARGVTYLRPGLPLDDIDALAAEHDLRLPEDARAVWAWHDGEDAAARSPALAPYREFPPLRTALELARTWAQDAIDWGLADDEDLADVIFRPQFVPVLGYQHPLVFDCRTQASTTAMWTPDAGLGQTPHLTMVERVRWWHWALDHGAWSITPQGLWAVDLSRYPGASGDLSVKDVLS
ncbi:hypothetical protein J1G42_01690 [Cellulomonas sp. zg-ZUI222]|uniref:hypothetical protein n=1 Tax=Cellulomonas TaxID=1707 RepID=UPI001A9526E3|nr:MULTISPECIES: hypothetical protein [Cellulomonas]MBO0898671.1 hypothetical protein [Cellulomonas sp. zg-ZUI22]MBO0919534.1 hypothetical protein [Cellulomonas wangleii]